MRRMVAFYYAASLANSLAEIFAACNRDKHPSTIMSFNTVIHHNFSIGERVHLKWESLNNAKPITAMRAIIYADDKQGVQYRCGLVWHNERDLDAVR